ncbi:Vacuolar protein-sorting-associated protein 27 [Puccinia graminis f. sp. tritici]|uniref:Vacuolar protein sorting-associated protein 27 n=1 Tax=Puccinia graminis f. sp. tritici TaxID=56615 RepID=A0A5B0M649_PUCGR|nr:Vacuolar protein-sorting-associated protein 27 [Puccinia graminis f. sp. tritici]KAA1078541.1 Vacuolar protein-sorting-associated protein 27 [Puccinia graminis f. sp. tritici]
MSSSNGFWWWSSTAAGASTEFDRLLETCTSSNLPSSTPPPITHSLNLSDLIRSSAVPASHALKSLQKRLDHTNPNVQLLVISAIDVCVKNGGDSFLKEVGGREFSEDCAQIISNPISNREVKEKLKREFQNWALAFESVPMLASSELVSNYRRLKTMGIEFPPKDPLATAAMVDSMSAPEWRDSSVCERCRTAFSFTNRKHHCRNCGGVFDGQCSSKKRALPHFGVTESVRVCDGCERSLAAGGSAPNKSGLASGRRNSFSGESSHPSQSKLSVGPNSHQRSATIHSGNLARATHRYTSSTPAPQQLSHSALSREEADLERAIALSLQESAASQLQRASFPQATSAPSHQSYHVTPSRPPTSTREDETDEPELAAAIAASLREAQLASNPHPSAPSPSRSLETLPSRPPLPAKSISEEHINTLLNFSSDVDTATRLGQLVPSNTDLNNRHAQAQVARLDLIRGIENAERRTVTLKEMNDKLSQAVKMYDRLLSDQIMYRTRHVDSSGASASTSQPYANHPPSHADSPYQPTSNQAFASNNQPSMYSAHRPNLSYPGQAVPISHNLTSSTPLDSQMQAEANAYPVQPNHHQMPSNYPSQQYGYPGLQSVSSSDQGVQSIGLNQTGYSHEHPAITSSHSPMVTTILASPALQVHHQRDAQQTDTSSWLPNNSLNDSPLSHNTFSAQQPSNPTGHSTYLSSQVPPMSQSPGIYPSCGTQLAAENKSPISSPNHFHPHEPQSNPTQQPSPGLSPVSHMIGSEPQAHHHSPSTHPTHPQGISMESVHHDVQPPMLSVSSQGIPGSEVLTRQPSFPSAPQTSLGPATPLPSFPNVPNTQLAWSTTSPNNGPYHLASLDVPSARQEEVAPLIEL